MYLSKLPDYGIILQQLGIAGESNILTNKQLCFRSLRWLYGSKVKSYCAPTAGEEHALTVHENTLYTSLAQPEAHFP
jgi:hypothetical protein